MNHSQHSEGQAALSFDVDLPLHPDTHSVDDVGRLVLGVLADIERLTAGRDTSHLDIVQALSIAIAVRTAMAETAGQGDQALRLDLIEAGAGQARLN